MRNSGTLGSEEFSRALNKSNFEKKNDAGDGVGPVEGTFMEKEFLQVAKHSRHSIFAEVVAYFWERYEKGIGV